MEKKLIILVLFLTEIICNAQNSLNHHTQDNSKFIDVDLTKTLTGYGFSKASLTDDLTPIDLSNFKSGEKHFLSSIRFDKQIAALTTDGYIAIIFLEKEFFYSYRRSCVNKEQDYGRCISVILMT